MELKDEEKTNEDKTEEVPMAELKESDAREDMEDGKFICNA